jgi:iron complex outermembrane receptor protein
MNAFPANRNADARGIRYVARASVALVLSLAGPIPGPAQAPSLHDLIHTNLEDLMDMQVTSVSKKEQKLSRAGAAIFVITQADIRSSGATNVPDLLRMAPGVNVAQVNANVWAISIRGFNGLYGDKVRAVGIQPILLGSLLGCTGCAPGGYRAH